MTHLVTTAVAAVFSSLLYSPLQAVGPSRADATAPRRATRAPQPPPGWAEVRSRALDLALNGKDLEVLALYERWVAAHPDFAEGHFMLGAAHESVARAAAASRLPGAAGTRRTHLEAAVLEVRRARALAGRQAPFMWLRALIDLYGIAGSNQPAEYERLVREGAAQYPAEPLAHAYLIALLAGRGEPIDAAARAARGAIPPGPDARVDLADALVGFVQDTGRLTPSLAPALLPEASRLVDEALALQPGDTAALETRGRIRSLQAASSRRPAAGDAGVRSALRTIASAQLTYAAVCANGYYAPTLRALATPEPGGTSAFISEEFVPARGATLEKDHYLIEMMAAASPGSGASCNGIPAGGSAQTFSITARPAEGFEGASYRIDASGTLTVIPPRP